MPLLSIPNRLSNAVVIRSSRARPFARRNLSKKVANLSKKVGNKERKFIDTQIINTAMANVGTITQLTNIVQGVTDATRLGRRPLIFFEPITNRCNKLLQRWC